MERIEKLLSDLSWNLPEEIQLEAIGKLQNIDDKDLLKLVKPIGKAYWENAALVLKYIGVPRVNSILGSLLEWISDMNWPGACTIVEILKSVETKNLMKSVEEALLKAKVENDDEWIYSIKNLLDELGITVEDFNNKEIYELLELVE